jgi:hypothetical protein
MSVAVSGPVGDDSPAAAGESLADTIALARAQSLENRRCRRRVREQARDAIAVALFSAAASIALALAITVAVTWAG